MYHVLLCYSDLSNVIYRLSMEANSYTMMEMDQKPTQEIGTDQEEVKKTNMVRETLKKNLLLLLMAGAMVLGILIGLLIR